MNNLFFPAVNKVRGYWLKGLTALANKPSALQIFAPSKFGINRTTGSKVMAKKFIWGQNNFLAITFELVVELSPNFEGAKICKANGLFAKAVKPLSQWPGTLFTTGVKRSLMPRFIYYHSSYLFLVILWETHFTWEYLVYHWCFRFHVFWSDSI